MESETLRPCIHKGLTGEKLARQKIDCAFVACHVCKCSFKDQYEAGNKARVVLNHAHWHSTTSAAHPSLRCTII